MLLAFIACFAGCLASGSAWADESPNTADLKPVPRSSSHAIKGLSFPNTKVSIRVDQPGSVDQKIIATVSGVFANPEWSVIGPEKSLLVPSDREKENIPFEFDVVLKGEETSVRLSAVGPNGTVQKEEVKISYPQFIAVSTASNEQPSLGQSWSVALGISSISYSQTGLADFSEVTLTPKFSFQYPLGQNWDLAMNAFFASIPISTNQSGIKAYFLGVNARAGYALPFIQKPWTISLAGGGYFATMYTSGRTFGYRNMFGPQIFPVIRRSIGEKDTVGTYFKYSPVSQGGSSFSFSSHELATGISFTRLFARGRSASLSLDYSQITVDVEPVVASASSVTVGAAYGF